MASIISPVECPNCHRVATQDDYYKSGEKYVWCFKCGYNYSQTITGDNKYVEKEFIGYGVCVLRKKVGRGKSIAFNDPISPDNIETYKKEFMSEDMDQENSFMVKYEDGEFEVMFGTLPDYYNILYEEGREDLVVQYPIPYIDDDNVEDW